MFVQVVVAVSRVVSTTGHQAVCEARNAIDQADKSVRYPVKGRTHRLLVVLVNRLLEQKKLRGVNLPGIVDLCQTIRSTRRLKLRRSKRVRLLEILQGKTANPLKKDGELFRNRRLPRPHMP